jgi:hypothetical protein
MDEQTMNHLMNWARDHRFKAFETVKSIVYFLENKVDRDTMQYLLENRSWSEIEELTFR